MSVLFGIHDREGRHIVPMGGWCVDTVALSQNSQPTDYDAARRGINWIVRLNWGYGTTGTIPLPHEYDKMAAAAANYVAKSKGAHRFIIGNEPNHEQERPNGVFIDPQEYARCFVMCRDAIKRVRSDAQVMPAPCAPYHANPMNWLDYWIGVLVYISVHGGCDGLAIHAYTRTPNPSDISSNASMGAPLTGQYSGFRTYRDALDSVPVGMQQLPVYITEFNEIRENGWHDANTGVVQAAYQEIDEWNKKTGTQKIHCLCLYRWPRFDKWYIEGKQGVIDDFNAAITKGYQSPEASVTSNVFVPIVGTGPQPVPSLPARDIDPRATQRGVSIVEVAPKPGETIWRVTKVQWLDEQQSQGRHHIYVDLRNSDGVRATGVPLLVSWPTGNKEIVSEAKPGEPYAANFPMSPSRNDYSIQVIDGTPSEMVRGIGMGADTPGGFNAGIHTSTAVTFQRVKVPAASMPQPTQPVPAQPVTVPSLAHPIPEPYNRPISQRFGENPQDYAKFGLAGHNGLDFAVPVGTPVVAVDDGKVIQASFMQDYGNVIKLQHAWGESVYAHLSKFEVTVGQIVKRGQKIALSGNTGNSTGPHLHFAIRVNPYQRGGSYDGFVDPEKYLSKPGAPQAQPQSGVDLRPLIRAAATEFGLEPELLASLVMAESSNNVRAKSSAGAMGLTQIMPKTWDEWSANVGGTDPYDARQNLRVGAAYLASLLRHYKGNLGSAITAYNMGPGNVDRGVEPPPATVLHVAKVVFGRDVLKAWCA